MGAATSTAPEVRPAATRGTDLVLSAWSVISPYGLGVGPFAAGFRSGASTRVDPEGLVAGSPGTAEVCAIPGFNVVELLGRKGTRSMDRATGIAVATLGLLLDGDIGEAADRDEVGLVLGTGSGSVQSIMDFTRDSLTGDLPFHVDPGRFPNTVMNFSAGQCAIWHRLKGPNATVAGGALSGLHAITYAVRLQRSGHCSAVIAGAVEELSAERAWLEHHSGGRTADPLGEGCALFLLQPGSAQGGTPQVAFAAARFAAATDDVPPEEALARCVGGVLDKAGMSPADIAYVAPYGGLMSGAEAMGIARALDDEAAHAEWLRPRERLGDTGAAGTAFQLAAVLAAVAERPPANGGGALVTAVDRDGPVGALLVRISGGG